MRKEALILPLFFLICCAERNVEQRLSVETGKKFENLSFKKVWQVDLYGGWCLAVPQGIVCSELLDRSYKESQLKLYDWSGKLLKERRLIHGDGPHEIKAWNSNTIWLSSSGKILTADNDYLKCLDPETLEIDTICKISNVIKGFGAQYTFGRLSYATPEENAGRTVTSFESTGFYEDMTHYIVIYDGAFNNLRVLARVKLARPLDWRKRDERKYKNGKRETLTDYYQMLRRTRSLSVDWKRGVVYFFTDIEKPVIESVDFDGKIRKKYLIDIRPDDFEVDREELDFNHEYFVSETDSELKAHYALVPYIPPHAPAVMGIKVIGDRVFVITGKRNWQRKENEALVYSLPSLEFEGSFSIPFPNMLLIQWHDKYYITRTRIKKGDDYYSSYEIYLVEKK
jgi:hypothetical protein